MLGQMVESGSLMTFQQLQQKYDLPIQDFYKYLQLRHYLNKHNYLASLQASPSNIEHFLISGIKRTIKSRYIFHAYKILQGESIENTLDSKAKWKLEMNIIIKDEDWE